MIRGAVFDFDGTLFDSMFIWDSIGSEYLRSIGFEPREGLDSVLKNMSLYQAACYYRSEYGVALPVDELMDGVNHMIEHYYKDIVQPKPNVSELLRKLRERDVKLCIATATDKYLIEAALERTGLDGYFPDILTCSEVGHGKDEPDIFRQAMRRLGTEKSDTLIFEDALYAMKTAKRDGFKVVGVFDKFEENPDGVKALADIYLSDYTDFDLALI